ncbi:GPP34 family phosphoprotein [Streptomyces albofaciens JCM 4342]|uniref:GOLPH3/VPS74 family protein n=1 Tax=Streptomyces albofaciens TaxID=66866 RepID=UPI00123BC5B1|nr:GPP34 family phosphoprotein [Streptomyces albofaciens]KAA6221097.1 GPP34 family phosphoprotein [Streptomyces albofaciens JCM 4342]
MTGSTGESSHPDRGPTLPEELLLLALDPEHGKPLNDASHLRYGLAGAALAELEWAGQVAEGRGGRIIVGSPLPLGDLVLDTALRTLPVPGKGGDVKAKRWVRSAARGIDEVCRQRLEQRDAVRRESRRALGLFRYERLAPGPVDLAGPARTRFKGALASGFADPRDRLLGALVSAVQLDRKLVQGHDRRAVRRDLKALAREHWITRAVAAAIFEDEAAASGG